MKEIIAHSPMQVRPTENLTHERLTSLLAAESANRLLEAVSEHDRQRLDVWNTFIKHPKFDNLSSLDRDFLVTELIDTRYAILSKHYNIERNDRLIIRDAKENYIGTLKNIISRLIEDKSLIVKKCDFHVCNNCSYIIAPKEANISACPDCQSMEIGTATMDGMFLNIDSGKMAEFEARNFDVLSAEGSNRVKSAMLTMPLVTSAVKHREHGVKLTEFGVSPEFSLDPKISIALAGAVARESGIGEISLSIQGIDSLKNNVPFTLLLDPETKTKFLNIGMVPPFSTPEIEKYGSLFFFPYLAMVIAGKSKKITGEEMKFLLKQFERTEIKLSSCLKALSIMTEKYAQGNIISAQNEMSRLNDAIKLDLKDGKFRNAIQAMQSFIFDWISRVYITQCNSVGARPDPALFDYIKNVLSPTFGK
jgi:hypothetical protein